MFINIDFFNCIFYLNKSSSFGLLMKLLIFVKDILFKKLSISFTLENIITNPSTLINSLSLATNFNIF